MRTRTICFEAQMAVLKKMVDKFLDEEFLETLGSNDSISTVINKNLSNDEKEILMDIADEIKQGVVVLSSPCELSWSNDKSLYERLYLRVFGLRSDSIVTYPDDLIDSFKEIIMELNETERLVIRKRFGLDGLKPMTLEDIGNETTKSRERIRQIEAKSLRKLRNPSRANRIKYGVREYNEILARKKEERNLEAECRLREHLRLMEELGKNHEEVMEKFDESEISLKVVVDALHVSIDEMELSVRSATCLRRKGLYYADDFFMMTKNDLMGIRAFGVGCYKDVEKALDKLANKKLGMSIEAVRDICRDNPN